MENKPLPQKAKMKFTENKFYTDQNKPIFVPGVVYEITGADQIQRWLKRGGVIVEEAKSAPCQSHHKEEIIETEVEFFTEKKYKNKKK